MLYIFCISKMCNKYVCMCVCACVHTFFFPPWRAIKQFWACHHTYPIHPHSIGRNVVKWPHLASRDAGNYIVSSWLAMCPTKIKALQENPTPCVFPRGEHQLTEVSHLDFPRPRLWPSCGLTKRLASRVSASSSSEFQ